MFMAMEACLLLTLLLLLLILLVVVSRRDRIRFLGYHCAIPGCPSVLCAAPAAVVVVVGGGTIGGSGCSSCGLRLRLYLRTEGVVEGVDVTAAVVLFSATTSRHERFD